MAVQLHAQAAKAWSRLGNRTRVEVSLDQGRRLMESLPYPENPENHFQVDPSKFDFYAMDCYRSIGEDTLALATAEAVKRSSTTPAGQVLAPMRLAEASLTEATVYARAGELDQAVAKTEAALSGDRKSIRS